MSNDQLPALIKNHTSTIPLYYLKDNQIVLFKEIDNISFQPSKQTSISDSHLIAFSKEIPRCLFTLDGWIKGCQCDDVKEYPYYPSTFEELYKQLIAQLWQSGISINWSQFYDKSLASRIPLPTYAFHRKRYWLDEKQTSYTTHQAESFISDTSDVMQKMIGLWQQFLGIEEIDGESNFFEKGGTSLSATSLITGIQKQFGIEIELKHLFEDPTVKGITNFVLDKLLLQVSDEELEALMGEPHG